MTTIRISELPRFEEQFRQYGFEWITRAPEKYSLVLVQEFYAAYKGELQR